MGTPSALHSKNTPRWGTPGSLIEPARTVLGGKIDLDPASQAEFNARVKAARFFTEADNGLLRNWEADSVFLNPPGGLVPEFWKKLLSEFMGGRVRRAVWIGFSVEQLCILQDEDYFPLDFAACILRSRVKFIAPDGTPGERPSHGNYVVAMGVETSAFADCFGRFGKLVFGRKQND